MKTIISMLALTAACASGVVGLVQPGAPSSCATWHTAVSGDSCYGISQQYSITIDAFLDANPQSKFQFFPPLSIPLPTTHFPHNSH